MRTPSPINLAPPAPMQGDTTRVTRAPQLAPCVSRSRVYAFVARRHRPPVELGSGRFAKAYLGEERWLESKTAFRRDVAIKILQKGVSGEDALRFQMEKEILERVQGHPNIVEPLRLGRRRRPRVHPADCIRDKVENDFMILELLDMSLEERLKGSRNRGARDDLLAYPMRERIFRVLEYMIPVARAVEYAHLVRNICHRDIKPANILVRLPDPNLRGSHARGPPRRLQRRQAARGRRVDVAMTRLQAVPGHAVLPGPEQETNILELLVNVAAGLARGRVLRGLLHRHLEERHVLALQPQRAVPDRGRRSRAQEDPVLDRPFARAERDQRARRVIEERRIARPTSTRSARCSTI